MTVTYSVLPPTTVVRCSYPVGAGGGTGFGGDRVTP
jgi:hypothetical protein